MSNFYDKLLQSEAKRTRTLVVKMSEQEYQALADVTLRHRMNKSAFVRLAIKELISKEEQERESKKRLF